MKSIQPLFIIILSVIAPSLFLAGVVFGHYFSESQVLIADSISSWVSAVATVAIAILTFILAKETWHLREAQISQLEELKRENFRPNIGFQLEPNPVSMQFMDVQVNNLGKGIAKKVKFSFYGKDGLEISDGENIIVDKILSLSMFNKGIESIGIGQKLSSFLFSFIDLERETEAVNIFDIYFDLKITFEDIKGNKYENIFAVDFSQYDGISTVGRSDTSSIYRISEEMEKIRKLIANTSSSGRFKVDVFDTHDREMEEKNSQMMRQRWQQSRLNK
ncbi:hypothetical protein [Neisseria dentiae]|uniref:hypothetical protein n=4 Tax=Neisseria dentiae TaxID=194197 RepID=UPI0035A083AA